MPSNRKSIFHTLLRTESEWNPKVMVGPAILPWLPEPVLHRLKKSYYAYLIAKTPETWMERDAVVTRKLISPGDTVLDIGANIGVYSRMLSRCVGPAGRVYAFEPIPQTFDFLSNNIRKLGLTNVETLDFAASDTDRTDSMVIPTFAGDRSAGTTPASRTKKQTRRGAQSR